MIASISGYAIFYFVRVNIPMAMPDLIKTLRINKLKMGTILTLHGLIYGLAKFANGVVGDRANARAMMVVGLTGSALMNLCFGLSSSLGFLAVFWMINGWFQGMGFPPCARLMTHWFAPRELARRMSTWNISHQLGGGLIAILCGYLVLHWGWRACFLVPAAIALVTAFSLWHTLPDTPPSVGLPEVEGTHSAPVHETNADFRAYLMKKVFRNKYVWMVSFSNFFVYTIRFSVYNWGPTMLTESKHILITHAGWMVAGFELSGAAGGIVSGWMTDRFFGGRAMRVGVLYMAMTGVFVYLLWRLPVHSEWLYLLLFCCIGFFIYGPQCLVSIAAANLATKRAAATAVGLTSIFGYGSTVLSGMGVGALVDRTHSWDIVFEVLLVVAGVGVLVFAACWPAKAHGYEN